MQHPPDLVEECGRVVACEPRGYWVATLARSGCGRCDQPGGCGQNSIFRLFGQRQRQILARSDLALKPGDAVVIGVPEGLLLRASLVVYLVPLLGLVFGAVAGQVLFSSEPVAILGALSGLTAGFLTAGFWSRRHAGDGRWQPLVVRRLPAVGVVPGATL